MKINLGCAFYGSPHFTPATTNNGNFFFPFSLSSFFSFILSYLMKPGGNLSGFLAGNQTMMVMAMMMMKKKKRREKKWINRNEVLVKAFELFTFWIQSIFNK